MSEMIDLIGSLPGENSSFWEMERGRYSVFINSNRQIQVTIESLVGLEQAFGCERFFSGYVSNFEAYGIEEEYHKDAISRTEDLREILENYLIVFQPIDAGNYPRIENVALTIKPSFYEDGMCFMSIPYFKTIHSIEAFMEQIAKKGGLRSINGIESCRHIPYILWQREGQPFVYAIGSKEGFRQWQGKMQLGASQLAYYELDDYEKKHLILNPRHEDEEIGFVEDSIHKQLVQYFTDHKPVCMPMQSAQDIANETQFLEVFQMLIKGSQFTYAQQDLINFHTAMKSGGFVILEGMSGTGKSRLVDFYRQALGLTHHQYKFVSVRSSWTDESDLLGYPDMMNQVYRPDHEGVVDLLIHAQDHPDELHLLCLDEMNLAKVEHYLSQFLSVLEMKQDEQWISLYNSEVELKNSDKYPSRIQLKGNLLFVGTINRDESTYHFSDKVLDRANVIQLSVTSLKPLYEMMCSCEGQQEIPSINPVSYKQYVAMKCMGQGMKLNAEEVEVLEAIHQLLVGAHWNKGVGYRILKQIDQYMGNLPVQQQGLGRSDALDLQIKQRILSKMRGDRLSFEGILVEQEGMGIPLIRCLEQYAHVAPFEASKKIIYEKVKELSSYGYTM